MTSNFNHLLSWAGGGVLVLWWFYRRLRRNIGLQQFGRKRLIYYIVIYAVASVALLVLSRGRPQLMLGWIGGLVPGLLLGLWGLRLTRFEKTADGPCYTPNAHLGLGLFLLFLGRLVYRVFAIYNNLSLGGRPPPAWGQSALTDLTFELLAGYYLAYNLGVLRRHPPEDELAAPSS